MGRGSSPEIHSPEIHSHDSERRPDPHLIRPKLKGEMQLPCKAAVELFLSCSESNIIRYYTISVIVGTVALAYGSAPLYKMVCADQLGV